jgi:hypothetical protein
MVISLGVTLVIVASFKFTATKVDPVRLLKLVPVIVTIVPGEP